jgi:hypothetical protein
VNEVGWIDCFEPHRMLKFLSDRARPHKQRWYGWLVPDGMFYPSYPGLRWESRKLRLFACACCRSVWKHLSDSSSKRAVEVAELVSDGEVTDIEFEETANAAEAVAVRASGFRPDVSDDPEVLDDFLELLTRDGNARAAAAWASTWALREVNRAHQGAWAAIAASATPTKAWKEANSFAGFTQAKLLREIFGNPFRPLRALEPSLLTWNGRTVSGLATAIYTTHAFERLPLLADALEDAGCSDGELLGHLRGPGPHVRGCWALDLVLGKS